MTIVIIPEGKPIPKEVEEGIQRGNTVVVHSLEEALDDFTCVGR